MQNQIDNDVIEIDLMEMLGLLLSRIWVIIGIGILTAAVGFSISTFLISPTYKSTTKIYILNKTDSNTVNYSDIQMGTQLTKDYAELINSRYVLESVIEKYGLNTDYEAFKKCVSVETPSRSPAIYSLLSASANSTARVALPANTTSRPVAIGSSVPE